MAITVNGVAIADTEIAVEMQYHPATTMEAAVDAAARALVVRELLAQEARRLGLDPAEDGALDRLVSEQVAVPEPDEETCRRYYRSHSARFCTPELYEVRHIVIAADPGDGAALDQARETAAALIAILQREPGRFAELAAAHSACPSKEAGGSLGQITRADVAPELATLLATLEENQLCPVPVRTQYGFHVLLLDRRAPAAELPFAAVRERIADYLGEAVWRHAVGQFVGVLAGRAHISGIDMAGWKTPLVQ